MVVFDSKHLKLDTLLMFWCQFILVINILIQFKCKFIFFSSSSFVPQNSQFLGIFLHLIVYAFFLCVSLDLDWMLSWSHKLYNWNVQLSYIAKISVMSMDSWGCVGKFEDIWGYLRISQDVWRNLRISNLSNFICRFFRLS